MIAAELYEARLDDPADLSSAYAFCRKVCSAWGRPEDLWGSRLDPGSTKRHLAAVGAFVRVLEQEAPERRALLEDWRSRLAGPRAESARHPVLRAVAATLRELRLPREPLERVIEGLLLLEAKRRCSSFEELEELLRLSAGPVGRLSLMIHGFREPELLGLCDSVCCGLQLARWLRDLSVDLGRDVIRLPQEDFRATGYSEADLRMGVVNERFRSLMKQQWKRARAMLEQGRPLAAGLRWPLAWEVKLAWLSGTATLRKIQRCGFDTLHQRPLLAGWDRPRLMAGAVWWAGGRGS